MLELSEKNTLSSYDKKKLLNRAIRNILEIKKKIKSLNQKQVIVREKLMKILELTTMLTEIKKKFRQLNTRLKKDRGKNQKNWQSQQKLPSMKSREKIS